MTTSITQTVTSSLAALALLLGAAAESQAQIFYSQLVAGNPQRFQLRQVNGNGTGDAAVGLPFRDVRFPTWSRDGGLFSVAAPDPNRPNDRSYNVFAINAATRAITPVTINQENGTDPQTGAFRYVIAQYQAFRADRNAMAISSTIVSGNGQVGQNETTPVLEVYTTASRTAAAIVHVYRHRNSFTHHGGEGVDWHPSQNVLAAGFETSAPYLSNPNYSGGVTALYLVDPVNRAFEEGRASQVTFPRADQNPGFFQWTEHDYNPKFSADGVRLAYVRSFQNRTENGAEPDRQSLRIRTLKTGADTEVLALPEGGYVDALDWSADNTALVFSFGQQRNGINGLEQSAQPQTNEIYVVNLADGGVRKLRGAGATTPAWKPTGGGAQPTRAETEALAVQAISGAQHGRITDAQLSGGAGTLVSKAAVGSFVTYNRPVPAAGTYRLKVRVKTGPNRGKFQLSIGGVKIGPAQDEYSAGVQYQARDLGLVNFSVGGNYRWRFTVTGKNPNSTAGTLAFDAIDLIPQ